METILVILLAVVVITGALAFTGIVKAATVVARFVFYIALVIFVGSAIAYLVG